MLLLVTMLPGHEVLWAQSKGFNVQGKASAGGERRVALVIGNAAYDMAPLRNPVNDARAMAARLRGHCPGECCPDGYEAGYRETRRAGPHH